MFVFGFFMCLVSALIFICMVDLEFHPLKRTVLSIVILVFLASVFAMIYASLWSPMQITITEYNLAALSLGTQIRGQYYLLSGYIDSSPVIKYLYYPDPNNRKKVQIGVKPYYNSSIVFCDDLGPKLTITSKKRKYSLDRAKYTYEFTVPENSLKEVYDVDISK